MITLNASTIAASTFLLAVSPLAETLEFAPKAGTSVVRTLHMERSSEIESATVFIADQEVDIGSGMSLSLIRETTFIDEIGKVEDGRVLDFVRTYESISDERSFEREDGEGGDEDGGAYPSVLEGQQVGFTWDAEDEVYAAAYVGDESGEDEWLEGLAASLDLVDWLPSDEMEVGGTWEIGLDELGPVIWYGGHLFPIEDIEEDEEAIAGVFITIFDFSDAQVLSGSEGEIQLTLVRVDEKDGERIAVVTFELSGSVEQDITAEASALNKAHGIVHELESAEQSIEMTGSGELHWNLEAGRLAALNLELQQDVDTTADWEVVIRGDDMDVSFEGVKSRAFKIELVEEQTDSEE